MRRTVPMIITGVIGFWVVFDFFLKVPFLNKWSVEFQNWGIVVAAFALGLAAVNLFRIHGRRIIEKKKGWLESSVLMLGLLSMIFTGIFMGQSSESFLFIFRNFHQPLSAAMFSLLVFFIASASFRAFRARSIEAAVLLVAGILLMLGNAPIGEAISPYFPKISAWLMQIPNLAGQRGIMIGAAIGIISVGLRVLLGIDRGYLGQE